VANTSYISTLKKAEEVKEAEKRKDFNVSPVSDLSDHYAVYGYFEF
jgi:hypothetical protein